MNKYLVLLILVVLSALLIGCWNYRELNSLYIVAGLAVDKADDAGMFEITVEAVNMKDTDFQPNIQSYKIERIGDAIFDSIREMIRISSKHLYWGHATTLIVSGEVAKDSIMPTLDLIARDPETRMAMDIFISKEKTAKELLNTQSFATDIRSYELNTMVNESKNLIAVPEKKVYELINDLALPKTHSVLPAVEVDIVDGKLTNVLSGGAVFNKDKLVGFLNDEDILPYLFIKNEVKGGLINVKVEELPRDTAILEIFNSKTKLNPIYNENDISFDIDIYTEVNIGELNTEIDYISEPGRDILKKLTENKLKNEIEAVIDKMQKQFGLDIFGFGNVIRQRDPKLWKTIEKDWDSIFKDLDVNVNCDIHIINSGHFSKPIEVFR